MKIQLVAGAEVDLLNADELEEAINPLRAAIDELKRLDTYLQVPCPKITVPSSGVVPETTLYTCPVGYRATIHRLAISADGFTPGAPLTTAGAWLAFWKETATPYNLIYPLPQPNSSVLPVVITEGNNAGPVFRNGQHLIITGALGAITDQTGLYVSLQVRLEHEFQPDSI